MNERDMRNLENLLFCSAMAMAASITASSKALDEIMAIGARIESDWTKNRDHAPSNYLGTTTENAWNEKFQAVAAVIGCTNLERICKSIGESGLETFNQYTDGLLTKKELVYWLINELAIRVGPEGRLKLGMLEAPKENGVPPKSNIEL